MRRNPARARWRAAFAWMKASQEIEMADNTESRSGNNNALYFIVGGLVVIAGIFLFLYSNGHIGGGASDVNVNVEAPAATDTPAPAAPAPAAPAN
jgi:hypothetical protein